MHTRNLQLLFIAFTITSLKSKIILPTWECYWQAHEFTPRWVPFIGAFEAAIRKVKEV
jgi:hypothetical protein